MRRKRESSAMPTRSMLRAHLLSTPSLQWALLLICLVAFSPGVFAQTVTMGDTTVEASPDSGNGNLMVAQQATLSQSGTLQTLSFYVNTVAGNLRLGVYDATGPSGGPGTKRAETNSFTPVVGWNVVNVITPVSLTAGTYWLTYLPSSDSLGFNILLSGSARYYSYTYGAMPTTFSTAPSSGAWTWSFYATLTTAGDTQSPTTPTGLTATAASATVINLSWTASTDNVGVTAYSVERCAGSTCTTFVPIAAPTGTTFSDTGLTGSTTYRYQVRARDAVPNWSLYSTIASATTSDNQLPTTPTGLTATAASATVINLSWTASTDNVGVTAYLIERCAGASCMTYTPIASVATTTYSNTALTVATTYRYRVKAQDAANNVSAYSSVVNATTQGGVDCD